MDIITLTMSFGVLGAYKNWAQDVKKVVENVRRKGIKQAINSQRSIGLVDGMNL